MNMEQIRAKLAGLNQKTAKRKDLWKPKDTHVIRCLPYPHGDEPILELGFHYDVGDTKALLCPKYNEGKDCVICDFADKLKAWNDENGVEKPEKVRRADFELFKQISVKERWYIPMIERGQEAEGPKFWAFGKSIYEAFLKMCLDEEMNTDAGVEGTAVLTDINSAYDITVDFAQANNKDGKGNTRSFPLTTIKEKKKPSKLANTKAECKALIEKIPPISEVYTPVTSEEVEKIFTQFVNSGAAEAKVVDEGVEYQPNSAERPVSGGQSIDEAFGELVAD